jgi:hypothetical protein
MEQWSKYSQINNNKKQKPKINQENIFIILEVERFS